MGMKTVKHLDAERGGKAHWEWWFHKGGNHGV
jgi:hypothetical protein